MKSKRTAANSKILVNRIKIGMSDKAACWAAGISQDTFYDWLRDDSVFSVSIQQARAFFREHNHKIIGKAATDGDWKAAAWLMAHREPEEYAEKRITQNVEQVDPWAEIKARMDAPIEGRVDTAGQDPDNANGATAL